jgi:RNA polymerase sigma-70 factor (ECF subfamily)
MSVLSLPRPRTAPVCRERPTAPPDGGTVRPVDADGLLVARIAAGDDEALAEAYDRFGPLVYGVARRVTGNAAAAEDVAQEIFVGLWSSPERFDPARGSLRGYLGVLAQRRATDSVRAELRRVLREQRSERLQPSPAPSEMDEAVVGGLVREAVRLLPQEQQQVVELAYFVGLPYREVAQRLNIPEGTAKSRLRLALTKLESSLDRQLLESA